MWTPKRILLVVLGFGLFVGCYAAYSRQLGSIDGLPPLPEIYAPNTTSPPQVPPERKPGAVVKKLELAFGRECPEVKRPIKIEVPNRGLVLAAKEFLIESDGRVRLQPLSVALFGKTRGEDGTPEINTIRGDIAYLTFERPIVQAADMGKHRITAANIAGNIHVVNNRRTLLRDDDLSVDISKGPLYYDQKQQKIWSEDFVHIEDMQSKPRPTQISGQGFVLDLITEQLQGKDRQPRQRAKQMDTISGVRTALLKAAVDMHLYVDAKSGFLASSPPKPGTQPRTPPDPKKPPEKSHLIVKTQGPFHYDMVKEFATFDVPRSQPGKPSAFPEHVVVTRVHDALGKLDQLVCEHLELQFRKKQGNKEQRTSGAVAPATAPSAKVPPKPQAAEAPMERGSNLEIEWAHAIGKSVILVSDTEMLEAHGHDFFYDARILTTTLKGKPMWAIQEGNEIQAQQLEITNDPRTGQSARARGPGTLSQFDKGTGKRPMKARWNDMLTTGRDGDHDLLHLTGKAAFIDEENAQELHADDLRIWLMPQEKKPASPAPVRPAGTGPAAKPESRSRRPHHLIATGNVRTKSAEFNIRDSQRFVVWFTDAPPGTPVPGSKKPAAKPAVPPAAGATGGAVPAGPVAKPATAAAGKPGTKPEPAKPEPKQPIDLWGKTVEAHVLRIGEKNELQKMRSEGAVHVVQAPSKKDEKGVDIKGDTLNLTAHPDGNYLVVTGDLARLDMDRMLILGPEVNIDQVANKAWVNGIGAMTIESDTDFEGKKLKKPTPLTIHWNRAMVFSGQLAVFHGGIQADQDNARLTCQELQVFFDKPISLKENQKEKERARVRNLTCDKSAIVEDSVIENGKELKYQRLKAPAIAFDNEEGTVQASGPGEVKTMERGGEQASAGPGGAQKPGPGKSPTPPKSPRTDGKKDQDMKLTYVSYYSRMNGYRKTNMAIFYTNVRVLHMPGDNPRVDIDLDKVVGKPLPEGAMFMRCDRLKVFTRPNPAGGKGWQEMEATGRVDVYSPDFSGRADKVTYDEEKDQVIFDGGQGGIATLYKIRVPGERPQMIEGQKIIYSRKTGKHTGENIRNIQGQ